MPFEPEQFRRRYPGRPFPDIRFRSEPHRWTLEQRIAAAVGRPGSGADDREGSAVWGYFDAAAPVDTLGSARPGVDLAAAAADCGLPAGGRVYVEWYSGDQIDVPFRDLADYFPAFWQAGADDLAVFDDSATPYSLSSFMLPYQLPPFVMRM